MRTRFTLPKYGWNVVVWYLDGHREPYIDGIEEDLVAIGCRGENLERAMDLLCDDSDNTGLMYSNLGRHKSVMVIGHTTDAEQCANTLVHERKHLEYNICQSYGINPYCEEAAYLAGDIAAKMYRQAQTLLCEDCRRKFLAGSEE